MGIRTNRSSLPATKTSTLLRMVMGKSAEKIGALDAWYEHSLLVASATKRSVGRRWPGLRTFDGYSHESEDRDRDDDCAVDLLELPFMLLCLTPSFARDTECPVTRPCMCLWTRRPFRRR